MIKELGKGLYDGASAELAILGKSIYWKLNSDLCDEHRQRLLSSTSYVVQAHLYAKLWLPLSNQFFFGEML
jgi:hypothetical protein